MGELSQLFWYRLVFMVELIVAEALFTFRLRKRSYFAIRAVVAVIAALRVSMLIPILEYSAWYCSLMFLLMFACTVALLKFCYAESMKNIIFCAMAAYVTQHAAFQLYNLLNIIFRLDGAEQIYTSGGMLSFLQTPVSCTVFLGSHMLVYFTLFLIFGRRIRKGKAMELKSVPLLILIAIVVLTNIVFSAIVTYHGYDPYNHVAILMLCVYDIVCCLLPMYLQFELLLRYNITDELNAEKRLRRMEREQYAMSKENIDLINIKCHDLKHHIRMIGGQGKVDREVLRDLEAAVTIYDSTFKTGNDALDTVLTEKSLLCHKNGARLSCVSDPSPLLFLRDYDLYALFGNAIDNAVESVSALGEEKRAIDVSIKKRGEMTIVSIRNFYEGELHFEDGLPVTTKADKNYHGFGMRSMREIVERYGGELTVDTSGNIFALNVLFGVGTL